MAKPEAREVILRFLREGMHRTDSARSAGIAFSTFREWMKDPEFSKAVKMAEADSRAELVLRIKTASEDPKHWTAAAWLLERRSPKKFGKRDRVEAKVKLTPMTPEEARAKWLEITGSEWSDDDG